MPTSETFYSVLVQYILSSIFLITLLDFLIFYFPALNLPLYQLKLVSMPLVAFNRELVSIEGQITLSIIVGTLP